MRLSNGKSARVTLNLDHTVAQLDALIRADHGAEGSYQSWRASRPRRSRTRGLRRGGRAEGRLRDAEGGLVVFLPSLKLPLDSFAISSVASGALWPPRVPHVFRWRREAFTMRLSAPFGLVAHSPSSVNPNAKRPS